MAMPWKRAKQIAVALRCEAYPADSPLYQRPPRVEFPDGYAGSRSAAQLTALFDACFRIQREASEAAGRHIPMVVENVKGAQPWVGRAKAHYGSYYLWGDVEDVGGRIVASGAPVFGAEAVCAGRYVTKLPPGNCKDVLWKNWEVARLHDAETVAHQREGRNFHAFENGLGSSPSFNGADHETRHVKTVAHVNIRDGFADPDVAGHFSSKSASRKAASDCGSHASTARRVSQAAAGACRLLSCTSALRTNNATAAGPSCPSRSTSRISTRRAQFPAAAYSGSSMMAARRRWSGSSSTRSVSPTARA